MFFTVDPAQEPVQPSELGPVGSIVLDVLLINFAAIAFLADGLARRRVMWAPIALALVASLFVALHGADHFPDLWRGSTWIAGTFAGIAAAHLARYHAIRVAVASVLLALIAPLVMRGLTDVFYQHPRDVSFFRANRESILQGIGIDPNSTSALIFERRVVQPEATGWFRLANVFGSFMVFGLVAWAGLLIHSIREKRDSGVSGACAIVVILIVAGLWYAGSKGAFAAAAAGLLLIALFMYVRKRGAAIMPVVAVGLPFLALAAVALRGAALPEGFLGEKSILFRWQYLVGAVRVVAESPVLGVGPDGFQAAYVQHRLPAAPEEVASAHSMFVDWIAMLGVGGMALGIIALILLWRAGRGVHLDGEERSGASPRSALAFLTIVAAAGLVPAFLIEQHVLDGVTLVSRIAGILAFILLGVLASAVVQAGGARAARIGFIAAAIAFFAHAQIEVTMTHPGALVAGWVFLGVAASDIEARADRWRTGLAGAVLCFALSVWMIVDQVIPAARQQAYMEEEATLLRRLASAVRENPDDSSAKHAFLKERADFDYDLIRAHDIMPSNPQPHEVAVRSWLSVARRDPDPDSRQSAAWNAMRMAERLQGAHPSPDSTALLAQSAETLARLTNDPAHRQRAIDARRELARLDPQSVQTHLALADLLWDAGEIEEARDIYRKTLELNGNWHLDELKQLREDEIERIQARIEMD